MLELRSFDWTIDPKGIMAGADTPLARFEVVHAGGNTYYTWWINGSGRKFLGESYDLYGGMRRCEERMRKVMESMVKQVR